MTPDEKQVNNVGPGGYKCICCGPSPKNRPKWRRKIRARLKALTHKIIRNETEETQTMVITVTVIWNDFTSEGDNAYVEVVEIEECADGKYHIEAIIRKAMEKSGYDNKLISEAFDRSYGLIGIIKGEVEWLA